MTVPVSGEPVQIGTVAELREGWRGSRLELPGREARPAGLVGGDWEAPRLRA